MSSLKKPLSVTFRITEGTLFEHYMKKRLLELQQLINQKKKETENGTTPMQIDTTGEGKKESVENKLPEMEKDEIEAPVPMPW